MVGVGVVVMFLSGFALVGFGEGVDTSLKQYCCCVVVTGADVTPMVEPRPDEVEEVAMASAWLLSILLALVLLLSSFSSALVLVLVLSVMVVTVVVVVVLCLCPPRGPFSMSREVEIGDPVSRDCC
jgi:hypothetical protein